MNLDEQPNKRWRTELTSGHASDHPANSPDLDQRPKKRLRTEPPSRTTSDHPASAPALVRSVHIIPQNARSLRITGIHSSVPYDEFRSFLGGLDSTLPEHNDNVLALSLAPDTSSLQVATVCFRHEPAFFAECTPGNTRELSYSSHGAESQLVVDCDFFGLTPLYTAPEPIVE